LQIFYVHGKLPGYNDLAKKHWASSYREKRAAMHYVQLCINQARIKPAECKQKISMVITDNTNRDADNIMSGTTKVILDALTNCGIIKDDGPSNVEIGSVELRRDKKAAYKIMVSMEDVADDVKSDLNEAQKLKIAGRAMIQGFMKG